MHVEPAKLRRIEWRLFLAAWLAYAFFHQGGGWNQNARFAMIRAIVEQGRLTIDDYLFYSSVERPDGRWTLVRTPIENGGFLLRGREWVLAWPGGGSVPVRENATGAAVARIGELAATGDLAFSGGSFYPNKAPGTTLLGAPAYFVLYHAERMAGIDPDGWWPLTVNAWLTTALSLGLVSALGIVAFFRTTLAVWDGRLRAATWSTVAFAFGTLFFPYATMLFEQNIVAVALLAGFGLLLPAALAGEAPKYSAAVVGGVILGWAAISTYIAVVPVLMIVAWSVARTRRVRHLPWLALGLALPFGVICWHNVVAIGSPFTTNYHFQNPLFQDADGFLQVLGRPRLEPLVGVLVSPFRGLFFSSPVLLAGVAGLVSMARGRGRRPEAVLFAGIIVFFLAFNVSFNGWHGGWGVGPRYMIPALPFLALAATWGFDRWFRTTIALAAVSMLTMFILTAVDPQSPVGASTIASYPGRPRLLREPLTEYALPLFFTGKARPLLDAQLALIMQRAENDLAPLDLTETERQERLAKYRAGIVEMLSEGVTTIPISMFWGPVSANPVGFYEAWPGYLFKPPEPEIGWNAFNAGELLLPQSRASLLYLLLVVLPLIEAALSTAGRGRTTMARAPAAPGPIGTPAG